MCGKLLMSEKSAKTKIQWLLIAGTIALIIGYSLDFINITPIIKKIATSSFVFASGGWAILVLCLFYWLIDVKKLFATGTNMFKIVGMNSIFIYIFFSIGGSELLGRIFMPFSRSLFSWAGQLTVDFITIVAVWSALWYICYWLYKNKVFVKI